jgi:regulator of protease activity HflC (stomatin/prohibitin superfamily)
MSNEEDNIFQQLVDKKKGPLSPKSMGVIIAVVAVILLLLGSGINPIPFVQVGAGERGVLLKWKAVEGTVLDEGLHFIIPVVHSVEIMDVTIQKSQTEAKAASEDIQETRSVIALNYQIDPLKANLVYQTLRREVKSRIIDPAVQEVVKAVTARYTAVDLITKRGLVRAEIQDELKDRLAAYNIIVKDFAILDFEFSEEFSKAIESKQTANQLAKKAENDLKRIQIEAKQKIESAKAEAESLRLQKQNISKDLLELRKIEAQMKAIEKWDGIMPRVTGGALPFVDAAQYSK